MVFIENDVNFFFEMNQLLVIWENIYESTYNNAKILFQKKKKKNFFEVLLLLYLKHTLRGKNQRINMVIDTTVYLTILICMESYHFRDYL